MGKTLKKLSDLGKIKDQLFNIDTIKQKEETERINIHEIISCIKNNKLIADIKRMNPKKIVLIDAAIHFHGLYNTSYLVSNSNTKIVESYPVSFSNDFSDLRMSQYRFQKKPGGTSWQNGIQKLAVAGEIAFEQICIKSGLETQNANQEGNFYSSFDLTVNKIPIDVKTKCHIGGVAKRAMLSNKSVDGKEIIALAFAHMMHTERDLMRCRLLGILDLSLLKKNGYSFSNASFYNPCLLIDFKSYFQLEQKQPDKKLPKFEEVLFSYFVFTGGDIKYNRVFDFIKYYGIEQITNYLNTIDIFEPSIKDLMLDLYNFDSKYDTRPVMIYKWIVNKIKNKETYNTKQLKEVISKSPFLIYEQKEYLTLLNDLVEYIPEFKCKFTGDTFEECEISENNGMIFAKSKNSLYKNTLISYSWYNGISLSIADKSIQVCDCPGCGCLTHDVDGRWYGKKSCSYYGQYAVNIKKAA